MRIPDTSDGLVSTLISKLISAIAFHIVGIIVFFVTVGIVEAGAELAGYDSNGPFIILAAAILVAGSMIAGSDEDESAE